MAECVYPGCARPARNASGGLCQACYRRARRQADPEVAERARESCRRAIAKKTGKPSLPRRVRYPGVPAEERAAQRRAAARKHKGIPASPERRVGACEICQVWADPLCLDHCHKTGQLRGWLCRNCNAGIGQLDDSPDRLRSAIAYLEKDAIMK